EHGRQGPTLGWDGGGEPAGLFLSGATEIVIVVGAARNAGAAGRGPVLGEAFIGVIGAFGGLDEGEGDTRGADRMPVYVTLPFGDIDAVDRVGPVADRRQVMWLASAEGGRRAGHGATFGDGHARAAAGAEHKGEGYSKKNAQAHDFSNIARLITIARSGFAV